MFEFGVEGLDRGGAHLFDEAVVAVHQLAVISAERAVRAAVNAQVVIEEIGFHQAAAAVGVQPPDLAVRHLAGRQAGHHAVGEAEGGIHVVDRPIAAAPPGRGQAHHRRRRQLQHQIDVVDHQIEHHGDVVGAIRVGAVAAGLQDHDLLSGHHLQQLAEGRVEAFDMPHLQQLAGAFGGFDQLGGLLLGRGDRLLDQHMHARLQAGQADAMVQQGGHGDADRLHLREHRAVIGEPAAAELLHRQGAALLIRIGHADQLGIPQQAQHASVMPAHVPDADDPDADRVHGGDAADGRIINDRAAAPGLLRLALVL